MFYQQDNFILHNEKYLSLFKYMCKVVKMRKKLYQDQIQILLQILMRSNSMFFSFLNQECFHLQEY